MHTSGFKAVVAAPCARVSPTLPIPPQNNGKKVKNLDGTYRALMTWDEHDHKKRPRDFEDDNDNAPTACVRCEKVEKVEVQKIASAAARPQESAPKNLFTL